MPKKREKNRKSFHYNFFPKNHKEKRGISPVITTVLIISIVVVISGIIFIFAKNSLEKAKEEAEGERLCSEVEFSVADFCHEQIDTDEGRKSIITFNGVNEAGSSFDGFLISTDYGGNIIPVSTLPYSELDSGEAKTLHTEVLEDINDIKKIEVIPRIKSDNQNVICNKNSETFDWEEIGEC